MSLHFPLRSGYFWVLAGAGVLPIAVGLSAACSSRERITFPDEPLGNGSGPITAITQPEGADTLVGNDESLIVVGYSTDPDGVAKVFFEVSGAGVSYAPLDGGGSDTVHFSLQLPTAGRTGDTIFVQVSAVDGLGDAGSTATRRIRVQ